MSTLFDPTRLVCKPSTDLQPLLDLLHKHVTICSKTVYGQYGAIGSEMGRVSDGWDEREEVADREG